MSKALEAARRAIESHPAYDCGSTGDEEMARDAISAYLSALAEDEEVVERVARALGSISGRDPNEFEVDARAALRALTEEK